MKIFACTLIILLSATLRLSAQLRDPNPEEKKVLDKAASFIVAALDQFNSNDWEKTNDYYTGELLVNEKPYVPIDINCNFEREYQVRLNSDRYNNKLKMLVDKINEATASQDYPTALQVGKQYRALSQLSVYAYINYSRAEVTESGVTRLDVPGVPYAYHTGHGHYGNFTTSYWLLFGNWAAARHDQDGLGFHFTHQRQTPYIENVVIIIQGADDRIAELLKTVDWSQMQHALTL